MTPEDLFNASAKLKAEIDAYSVTLNGGTGNRRRHLGASEIGDPCARRLQYKFRWFHVEQFDGRMMRLFDRGHIEEQRLYDYLRSTQWEVRDLDPATGEQWKFQAVGGHFSGSCDGFGYKAVLFPYPALLECKTFATQPFGRVQKNGVQHERPKHWSQMCVYGNGFGYEWGLYFPVNKNDDAIAPTFVKLDLDHGRDMTAKADTIIRADTLLPKIDPRPSYHECKPCAMADVCHYDARAEINCRSCQWSAPQPGKAWLCRNPNAAAHNCSLSDDAIAGGCPKWEQFR